jgi:hypothetical protein
MHMVSNLNSEMARLSLSISEINFYFADAVMLQIINQRNKRTLNDVVS